MHAASVHPEPGSNSQTNCISSAVAVRFLSELFILAFFTFLELCSLWFWQILYSHLLFCFVLLSSVVQLSSFNRSFCASLVIISHSFRLVKYFLKISLKNFWLGFCDIFLCRFRDSFIILPLSFPFVNTFLKKVCFCRKCQLECRSICANYA